MPTITDSSGKKKKKKAAGDATGIDGKKLFKEFFLLALSGGVLGLSAPGLNQCYIAWIGLAPLLISISTSTRFKQAFIRGLVFGTAYAAVCEQWLLGLQPLTWPRF